MHIKKSFSSFIGTKQFYSGLLVILVPLIIQQGITSFVNLLDNIMVGQLGTEEISAVAIVNQIIFIVNLAIFGCLAGVSIFGAQFSGKGDVKGLKYSFRLRLYLAVLVTAVGIVLLLFSGESLIAFFLNETEGDSGDIQRTLSQAKEYMGISLVGLIPFAVSQSFSSTLKDTGETKQPMAASIIAIMTNFTLNLILIFGLLGFPKMGVAGAALATVIARFVEMFYIVFVTIKRRREFPFVIGAFRSVYIPLGLIGRILKTGTPLLFNEILWALGMTIIAQCYSMRGLSAVTAVNINNTVWNVFSIVMMAMGNAVGIMAGQQLGADNIEGAKDTVRKLIFFDVVVNTIIGCLIMLTSPLIPQLYNTTDEIRTLASQLLLVAGIVLPIEAFTHAAYFTLRSGGKTVVTFLFDCVFTWAVSLPAAWMLSRYTSVSLVWIFLSVQLLNLIKVVIGAVMVKSGIWARNVVNEPSSAEPAAEANA